ncbi:hypothetical protein YUMDRAFT_00218 [Streptomyces sp. OspMP-M45]|nr:hypothetical protein YUMDRAFT_00218 [Streptomyces sp. OspMP-M45]
MRLSSGPMYVADPPSASPVRGSGAAWCRRAFGPLNGGMVHRTVTASTVPACRTPIRPARSATASAPSSAERPRPLPGHVPGGGRLLVSEYRGSTLAGGGPREHFHGRPRSCVARVPRHHPGRTRPAQRGVRRHHPQAGAGRAGDRRRCGRCLRRSAAGTARCGAWRHGWGWIRLCEVGRHVPPHRRRTAQLVGYAPGL